MILREQMKSGNIWMTFYFWNLWKPYFRRSWTEEKILPNILRQWWLAFTVNLTGFAITLEIHRWASLSQFPDSFTEQKRLTGNVGETKPWNGIQRLNRKGEMVTRCFKVLDALPDNRSSVSLPVYLALGHQISCFGFCYHPHTHKHIAYILPFTYT